MGLIIGNVIGLGLLFIQKQFSMIKLDPEIYYTTDNKLKNFDYILLLDIFYFFNLFINGLGSPKGLINKFLR